ncbi:putative teichuronic acid biosynthesis glycosyltransferase TuaG [Hartmannibacter diazotrophicus]|uniref:Putative teichuronic acid biosynthesis glycosyltransferase TuaG n=1 Tax=Hartmannibacter diazotrophicus TaxID=1482074 RepID=A0A2C9D4L4_9HYPH|nr:glycosyltransferase family 2 protein [Hartmannibacter diazotrophicus]SON54435.1 putative teichuronic acid biosynthesis glycosyltransferase TuaG [Hartmannibacter diazotrophicus]
MFVSLPALPADAVRKGLGFTPAVQDGAETVTQRLVWKWPRLARGSTLWVRAGQCPIDLEIHLFAADGSLTREPLRLTACNTASISIRPDEDSPVHRVEVRLTTRRQTIEAVLLRQLWLSDYVQPWLFDNVVAGDDPLKVNVRCDLEGDSATVVTRRIQLPGWVPRWIPQVKASEASRLLQTATALAALDTDGSASRRAPQAEPLISFVVPVYNALPRYLDDLLRSFRQQEAGLCELVLSDDASPSAETRRWLQDHQTEPGVTVVFNETNRGIALATNAGIERAQGQRIALLDHDDAIVPFAASRIAKALEDHPETVFLYTDEVITDDDLRPTDLFLKPAFDPVLLSGVNYVNHFSVYRRDRLIALGCLSDGYQGSQDYELLLRYTAGLERDEIRHLPFPAYLWRRSGETYSAKFLQTATQNARRALSTAYGTDGPLQVTGAVNPDLHRVRFDLARTSWPLVTVVIPNRNSFDLIAMMLDGLTNRTDYPNLEIIVIDNGSTDQRTLDLYEAYSGKSVPFTAIVETEAFNFSRSVNKGLARAKGDIVLLANNDLEVLEPDWLKEMVSCFDYPDVGIVGAKLLYPNRRIQHAGVIAGFGQLAGHWFLNEADDYPGPMGRLWVRQSMTVVTGACMAISRPCLDAVGTFDEIDFAVAYNDVDYCLRAHKAGFRTVWTPFAKLVHHESATRGSDETPENIDRFRREQENLKRAHQTQVFEDPAINPWYSKDRSNPHPVLLKALPQPR